VTIVFDSAFCSRVFLVFPKQSTLKCEGKFFLCGEKPRMVYGYSCGTLIDVQKDLLRIVLVW
jgi:hypothetical protein